MFVLIPRRPIDNRPQVANLPHISLQAAKIFKSRSTLLAEANIVQLEFELAGGGAAAENHAHDDVRVDALKGG
jgi:hypothetical protein